MKPENEQELAEMIAGATEPLSVIGGGTRGMSGEGRTLSVAAMSGLSLYEPGALTLVAQAGTPVAEIEAVLAAENQRLAFEPIDHRVLLGTSGVPTIGGVMAANVSGPRRIAVGAARDFLLGVRFVDGRGSIIKNGGRVMKNVTGYDLVKLLAGSFGTLGVLSEVALKVLPKVETEATLRIGGLCHAEAVRAMAVALGSPFEVTGAAHRPGQQSIGAETLLRIEGFADSVSYRAGRLVDLLAPFGASEVVGEGPSRISWADIRDVKDLVAMSAVWRVSVKPGDAPAVVRDLGQGFRTVSDWGGGLIWIGMDDGMAQEAAEQVAAEQVAEKAQMDKVQSSMIAAHFAIQKRVAQAGGHATLVKAPAAVRRAVPRFQPESAGVAQLTNGLRTRFDPRAILNVGLMGAGA